MNDAASILRYQNWIFSALNLKKAKNAVVWKKVAALWKNKLIWQLILGLQLVSARAKPPNQLQSRLKLQKKSIQSN